MVGKAKKLRCSEWFLEQGQPIEHFLQAHPVVSSRGCDRLNLRALPGGQSIRIGREVISADNAWAYVAELSGIAGAMSARGVVVLHPTSEGDAIDGDLVEALSGIMNIDVDVAGHANVDEGLDQRCADTVDADRGPSVELTSRDHHSAVFDPRRPVDRPGPMTAVSGMVIKHSFELAGVVGSETTIGPCSRISMAHRLRPNERLLGSDGETFWRPVLVNVADGESDAIPLTVMHGDHSGTVELAAALEIDLAIVTSETGTRFHLVCHPDLRQRISTGAWRLLIYSRVTHGMVPIIMPSTRSQAATSRISPRPQSSAKRLVPNRSFPKQPPSRRPSRPAARRIDAPHEFSKRQVDGGQVGRPFIERPHRSQASRPANYSVVLRNRHLSRQPHRTDVAPRE